MTEVAAAAAAAARTATVMIANIVNAIVKL
jgi:hypothetical protein